MRRFWLFASLTVGCFNPEPSTADSDVDPGDSGHGSGGSEGSDGGPGDGSDSSSNDSADAVCGDGTVEGDEVCDDGVNDGSYGGCEAGCGAIGPRCGDRKVDEGYEVCDDGVNDGSYGGCAADCSALAGFCGDGDVQEPEGCDRGEDNENGSGCNVDCVVSGSVVAEYDLEGISLCDGAFLSNPVFRGNGNALLAATGYCPSDTQLLLELSPQAEVVEIFEDILLPETPVRFAAMIGDEWLLSAYQCNYVVANDGGLTEVCEEHRTAGYAGMIGYPNGSYVALDTSVARYADGSPFLGDAPAWTYAAPSDEFYSYYLNALARGPSNSILVGGSLYFVNDGTSYGYVARLTAAGNLAGSTSTATVTHFNGLVVSRDGWMLGATQYDRYQLLRLEQNFAESWTLSVPTAIDFEFAIDSTGDIVVLHADRDQEQFVVTKWAPDGPTEKWSREVEVGVAEFKVAIDADDSIWVASMPSYVGETLRVRKLAP